ncbi:hypothetical protein GCM10017653_13500 [Ancylobacter defluvii]|uniref:Uncharacterized protein n=1 Tax=Ancylobacter defluvii TaxID=1282440 RepID=A0A9W6JT46_9HYPH|nr:hypothetical protein GCM10017653_13500 [Ancylobacter defluvii]
MRGKSRTAAIARQAAAAKRSFPEGRVEKDRTPDAACPARQDDGQPARWATDAMGLREESMGGGKLPSLDHPSERPEGLREPFGLTTAGDGPGDGGSNYWIQFAIRTVRSFVRNYIDSRRSFVRVLPRTPTAIATT